MKQKNKTLIREEYKINAHIIWWSDNSYHYFSQGFISFYMNLFLFIYLYIKAYFLENFRDIAVQTNTYTSTIDSLWELYFSKLSLYILRVLNTLNWSCPSEINFYNIVDSRIRILNPEKIIEILKLSWFAILVKLKLIRYIFGD